VKLGRHIDAGWKHDLRSRNFPAERAGLTEVNHQILRGGILDQGDLGSCTGNAAVYALNCSPDVETEYTEEDAVASYSGATVLDPYPGHWPSDDTGSDGLSVAKFLRLAGIVRTYRHAFGLGHVLQALALRPVMIGIPWYEGMMEVDSEGFVNPTGAQVGGHEICLTGIGNEYVSFPNSWGDGWGKDGYGKLSWTNLGRLLSEGGDAIVLVTR
jgi:hypothetical protein